MQEVSTSKSSPAHCFPNLPDSLIIDQIDLPGIDPFSRQPYQSQTLSTSADEGILLESLRVYRDRISMWMCSGLSEKQRIVDKVCCENRAPANRCVPLRPALL